MRARRRADSRANRGPKADDRSVRDGAGGLTGRGCQPSGQTSRFAGGVASGLTRGCGQSGGEAGRLAGGKPGRGWRNQPAASAAAQSR
jgi:hypothetical protein